jgi:hypothetical protein
MASIETHARERILGTIDGNGAGALVKRIPRAMGPANNRVNGHIRGIVGYALAILSYVYG